MFKDKFCELEEESSGWLCVGRALVQEMFQGREAMVWGMLVYRDETSTMAMMVSGGKEWVGIGSYQGSG